MSPPRADRWAARIARARLLASRNSSVVEPLTFYAALAALQSAQVGRASFRQSAQEIARLLPDFLRAVSRVAPARVAAELESVDGDPDHWIEPIEAYREGESGRSSLSDRQWFAIEAILQPLAEVEALAAEPAESGASGVCAFCGSAPVVSVLREDAHSARRSLICGLCFTEWPSLRLVCLSCGESRFESLPVFRADEMSAARIDACETCRTYTKTIDLTRDGSAEPIVDDIATLSLDLWAREQGYSRVRKNLLRL